MNKDFIFIDDIKLWMMGINKIFEKLNYKIIENFMVNII